MNIMQILYIIMGVAVLFSFLRALLGPHSADRVVAVDVLTNIISGFMVVYALHMKNSILLDVALVYTVLSFITVLIVARYMERGI